jgi:hypothetical protein
MHISNYTRAHKFDSNSKTIDFFDIFCNSFLIEDEISYILVYYTSLHDEYQGR